jgi:beta-lactamase class A
MPAYKAKRFLLALVFSLLCFVPVTARAEAEGVVRYGVTPTDLQDDFFENSNDGSQSYNEAGYRPARLTGYVDGGNVRYFTRWVQNTGGIEWRGRYGKTLAEFNAHNADYRQQGFYLVDVSGYQTSGGMRYAGLWYRNTGNVNWLTYPDLTVAQMQTLHDTIGQNGWRPHRIEGYDIGGQSRYISVWYHQPGVGAKWHSKLTPAQYQDKFDDYKALDYAPVHVDSHTVGGQVFYSAIWRHTNTSYRVRTNREVRVFQRYYNNNWADGFNIDNFYAAETPAGVRFGGIWYFDGAVVANDNSPLSTQVRKAVDGAPALGGAAVLNLTTGYSYSIHGNQTFAVASTSKIGILYALLREADSGNVPWMEIMSSGAQFGGNQGPDLGGPDDGPLLVNTNYKVFELARLMIRYSNNWATNRLIQRIGMATINQRLDELGLNVTRVNRYMTGAGAPSVHGNTSSFADRQEGWENLSTPNEMIKLLRRVLQDNVLSNTSETRFWDVLGDDDDGIGENNRSYFASQVASMFNPDVTVFNKAGSLSTDGLRIVRADAGRFTFPDGQEVLVACIMDYITDDQDELTGASDATKSQADQAIKDVAKAVANKFYN